MSHTQGNDLAASDFNDTTDAANPPTHPTPTENTDIDEIWRNFWLEFPSNGTPSMFEMPPILKTAIEQKLTDARIDELKRFTHSEGSVHILAEKVSYQPANHDPIHSWPIIDGKVIIIAQDYARDRIKALQASKEGK